MFWTAERLQVFTSMVTLRCRESWNDRMRSFPLQDHDWFEKKAKAERESRRVRLWCDRKDAAVDAELAARH